MSREFDYLIVGAGLFGAVFAREMTDAGRKCLVIDRRGHIAGNAYTETVEGIDVHRYGAHIFHTNDEEVWAYVNRFARFNRFTNSPIANYRGELYNLPFNMNTFHQMWGVITPEQAREEICRQQAAAGDGEPRDLEGQGIRLVGRDIYEKLVKGYTQKQWGRPCTELPAFIIRRLPVRFTYDNNYFNARYQGIPEEGYTALAERLLAGIRYTMTQSEFSSYNPYTFATDISDALLAAVKESSSRLPGVDGVTVPVRTYLTGSLASHVLGVTGSISSEEYNKLKEAEKTYSLSNPSGYRISDTLGKSGIERVMEDELRGQNGLRTVVQDQEGNVIRVEETEEAVPGHTVQLTLVQSVQAAAQKALADRISYLNNNAPATRGKEAEAGAVVAIDVKTGGVIAMASYPDYSLDEYYQTYSEMVRQSPSPLLNRATQGLYTVGSTYKPAVSLAALDTGTVTATDRIRCTGRYTYYRDYQPVCEGVHGPINVIDALRVSCNIFFYDMGRRMGIETINEYSYSLGLGHATGIELPELAGQLSSPETRAAIGEDWYDSYDLQSAIGQLDNQFTILQMASYTATLASRGQRMQVHLVG